MRVFSYTADEILQTAVEIETNAARFYRSAAESGNGFGSYRELFSMLCAMEENHARIFGEMRRNLSVPERTARTYDPGNEMLYYLEGMTGLHAWEGKTGPEAFFTGHESVRQVLATAVAAERDTVFFYTFLRDYVPESKGREIVDRVLKEEMRHVAILNRELAKTREGADVG